MRPGIAMKTTAKIILSATLLTFLGCGLRKSKGPDWATSAPIGTVMAVSSQASWVVQRQEIQTLLGQFPIAERTLDLFLKRAHINPMEETGRVSFYVMDLKLNADQLKAGVDGSSFLIQLGGFREPRNLLMAITEAFPMEGTLLVGKRELPLYVLLDYNQFHMRILFDEQDRIWIGDISALAALGRTSTLSSPTQRAAEWINARAPIQGLVLPEQLLELASQKLPKEFAKELPKGIQALAWSVTPSATKDAPHCLELAVTGTPEGIRQIAPWVQRLLALVSNMPGAPSHPADVLEEQDRIGLKAQLNASQLESVMSRISQPGLFKGAPSDERQP